MGGGPPSTPQASRKGLDGRLEKGPGKWTRLLGAQETLGWGRPLP